MNTSSLVGRIYYLSTMRKRVKIVDATLFHPDNDRAVLIYLVDLMQEGTWTDGYFDHEAGCFFPMDLTIEEGSFFVSHWVEQLPDPR